MTEPKRDTQPIHAIIHQTFHIHLWEDRTRGELWVPSYKSTQLVLVDDEFLRTASGNAVDAGRRTFEFEPVATGSHQIIFEKRMGWKFTAEDRRVFLVEVGRSDQKLEQ